MDFECPEGCFSDKNFWDDSYGRLSSTYDWYIPYAEAKKFLSNESRGDEILVIGCGQSEFSEDMFKDGYKRILSVDFSSTAIQTMIKRAKNSEELKGIRYLEMDVTHLLFDDETFDIVIDKGTLDAILTAHNEESAQKTVKNAHRVLKTSKYSFSPHEIQAFSLVLSFFFRWQISFVFNDGSFAVFSMAGHSQSYMGKRAF
jgi:ubiquinone/menaquinone biosynthesis C-methylase UbiE